MDAHDRDLETSLAAFNQAQARASQEAIRRLYASAQESQGLHEDIEAAQECLRNASSVAVSPLTLGIEQLTDERNGLRTELTEAQERLTSALEVMLSAKAALQGMTTPEHPWYPPGEPDGEDYHCFRCKALNDIEGWRNG